MLVFLFIYTFTSFVPSTNANTISPNGHITFNMTPEIFLTIFNIQLNKKNLPLAINHEKTDHMGTWDLIWFNEQHDNGKIIKILVNNDTSNNSMMSVMVMAAPTNEIESMEMFSMFSTLINTLQPHLQNEDVRKIFRELKIAGSKGAFPAHSDILSGDIEYSFFFNSPIAPGCLVFSAEPKR